MTSLCDEEAGFYFTGQREDFQLPYVIRSMQRQPPLGWIFNLIDTVEDPDTVRFSKLSLQMVEELEISLPRIRFKAVDGIKNNE